MDGACGLNFDRLGNLYVCEATNNRIRKIDTAGIINTIAGTGISGFSGDGGPATAAELWNVNLVSIDTLGNVYIGDMYNDCIRKIAAPVVASTSVGSVVFTNVISLYPKPAATQLTITATQKIKNITIADVTGQTVYSNEYNAGTVQLDVAFLPAGVYVIKANGADVRKFVKE